ncbi:MAG: 50S ribosomal protein L10 [Planctomycetota bacterium]|nr:MAG: 50S ribosomal protein L10 [Planctomycetota bacterium]
MPNLINREVSREYESVLIEDLDTLVLQPVGMTVEDVNAFRGKLSEAGLRMRLVKGSLARRIMESRGLSGLDDLFDGPAAVVEPEQREIEVEGVAITAARVVEAWLKESGGELPQVKGGVMDGEVLDGSAAARLAKLPTKPEMQSILAGQIVGPARTLSAQFTAPGAALAGALKTRIESLEDEA